MRNRCIYLIPSIFLIVFAFWLAYESNYGKLVRADFIYKKVAHPSWSVRIIRDKSVNQNNGSGNHKILFFVDVRKISGPIDNAIVYYRSEAARLGLRECHVDRYADAKKKFVWEWQSMGLSIPPRDDVLIISQRFSSDSSLCRK
jgi:hypothetical protein